MRQILVLVVPVVLGICANRPAQAQMNPSTTLGTIIQQLQTGTPNPALYGIQLWTTIAAQTANSGIYPQLVSLGPTKKITVSQQISLPGGTAYSLVAEQENGTSTWQIGVSAATNRVEYLNFVVGSSVPQKLPDPTPNPPITPNPGPGSSPDPSPACQKFPNLCP